MEEMYRVGEELGRGGFGTVYSGLRIADNLPVAIKRVARHMVTEWADLGGHRVPLELKLLQKVQSVPGVIRLYDFFERRNSFVYILERPSHSIDLFDHITKMGTLTEDVARGFLRSIINTVTRCHRLGVTHRDIKDENILIDLETGRLRLIDFGSGAFVKEEDYTDRSLEAIEARIHQLEKAVSTSKDSEVVPIIPRRVRIFHNKCHCDC